jgi:HD-GYP domain-containing protein (c-di-GMP phosphodiesterase class II)
MTLDYVHLPVHLLGNKEKSFLFDLYLYSAKTQTYVLEWKAHKKVPIERLESWQGLEQSGYRIAVLQKNKKIMMLELGIKDENVLKTFPPVKEDNELRRLKEHVLYQRKLKLEMAEQNVDNLIKNAIVQDNFLPLIQWTQKLIFSFDINKSITVSNARALAELFDKDNYHNRIVALTIQYALFLSYKSQEDLADLFCAAILKDLGFVFLHYNFLQQKLNDISRALHKDYWKHPAMTLHFVKKSGIELSPRCEGIINHHHETPSGSGYPNGLGKHQVDPLTYILGIVEAVVLHSSGKIQNHKLNLYQVLQLLREKKPIEGLLPFPMDDYELFANFALKAIPLAKAAS